MTCVGIGFLLVMIGVIFKEFPPKKINSIYGYRTNKSMINQKTWDYSQKVGAMSFIYTGLLIGLIGSVLMLFNMENTLIEVLIFIVLMVLMLVFDEKIIKKYIDKNS